MRRKLPLIRANALLSLAFVDFDAGHMQRGADRITEAIKDYLRADDQENAARSLASLSFVLYGMGCYDDARDAARRGIQLATEGGHDSVLSNARVALGNTLMDLGRYSDALATYRLALDVATEIGDTQRENVCLLNIALTHIYQGMWDAAEKTLGRITAPGRVIVPRLSAAASYNSGLLAEGRGDWREAERHYAASLAAREQIGQAALIIDSLAGLLRVAVAQGEHERTNELTGEIERRLAGRGLDGIEHPGYLFVALIEAALAREDRNAARGAVERATAFLHGRAGRLANAADRESYLYEVRPHRRIFALAARVLEAKG
jgi:tetratricopeptide (TPR) repeat protein